ncbi:PAS domain S-box protein [Microvirga arabica]|uniref:PAS domain S-box protein n=1 Tax=Microvirga arabica TaxID=1128671 RepID=UPI00193A8710|nr:PAS domain S-box protein [Microvirga arabica]MBM1172294.1 PAS domain S-box protein [Microvirga arabica]
MKTINFEALFSASPNPYVLLDLSLNIVGMNDAYLKVTMREREDLVGRNMFEAFPSDPDTPSHRQLRNSFEKVIREKLADHIPIIEYAIPLPNGQGFEERFWSATHTPLFNHAGEMTFILQHTVDVTELQRLRVLTRSSTVPPVHSALIETDMFRRAQAVQETNQALTEERQHLRGLFEQAPGFMAALSGPDHVFTMANAAYLRLVGRDDIVGKPVRQALPEVVDQGFVELLDRVYDGGQPFVGRRIRILLAARPGGTPEEHFLDFLYQPLLGPDGMVSGIFVQGHDVTEQNRIEDALRASEARLRLAIDAGRMAIWELDAASDTLVGSPELYQLLGFAPDAQPSIEAIRARYYPGERERMQAAARDVMARGERFVEVEFRYIWPDESIRWLLLRAEMKLNPDGTPSKIVGVALDITERKRSQEALRESEQRFRLVAESAPVMLWMSDQLGKCVYLNRAQREFWEVEDADVQDFNWGPTVHLDDQEGLLASLTQAVQTHSTFTTEARFQRSDGQYRIIRSDAQPRFGSEGEFLGMIGVNVDITEARQAEKALQESEERFRVIANSIDQLIWATQPDGFHDYYNQRWYEYTGVPEGTTDGEGWNGMFHSDDQDRAWGVWRRCLETGEPYHIEYRLRHRSGEYRWVLGRAQPLRGSTGRIVRWYGSCTDIHDLKQAQEEIRRLASMLAERVAELDEANEEIQRFAYIVSHDLRAPLVNVMGFTSELEAAQAEVERFYRQVLGKDPHLVTPEARMAIEMDLPEAIGFIRSSTVKMDKLINAILKLSREGRRVLMPEPLSMRQLLEAQCQSVAHQLHGRGAELLIEAVPNLTSDRLAIEQIFGNLIDNAVKYLDSSRPGRIVVRGRDHGVSVQFEIEDNGRGIAPQDFERIFDLFRRSGVQDQQGEGIGLAHVRALVRRLGGTITVSSRLGEGSTFTVVLPKYISMTSEAA